jgi:hypothetical protein
MKKQLDNLFDKWKLGRSEYTSFILDGIFDYEKWGSQKKILFLMKESHSMDSNDDLAKHIIDRAKSDENLWSIWKNVALWTYCINLTDENKVALYKELTNPEQLDLLSSIAFVNVKKENGESISNNDKIAQYAIDDRCFLKKQIEIINPEIIICCYTMQSYENIYSLEKSKFHRYTEGVYFHENRVIIDFYHPANRFPRMMNFYTIGALYHQYLRVIENKA